MNLAESSDSKIDEVHLPAEAGRHEPSQNDLYQALANNLGSLISQRELNSEVPKVSTTEERTAERSKHGAHIAWALGAAALSGGAYLEATGTRGIIDVGAAMQTVVILLAANPLVLAITNRPKHRRKS